MQSCRGCGNGTSVGQHGSLGNACTGTNITQSLHHILLTNIACSPHHPPYPVLPHKHHTFTTPQPAPPHKHHTFTTPCPPPHPAHPHKHHTFTTPHPPPYTVLLTNITFTTPCPPPHPVHPHKYHMFTTPHPPPYTVLPQKQVHYTTPSSIHCTSSQTSHSYTTPSPIHCTSSQTCSLHHAHLHTLYLLTNITFTTPRPPPYTVPPHKHHVHYSTPSSLPCTSSQTCSLHHALLHTLYLLTNMFTTPRLLHTLYLLTNILFTTPRPPPYPVPPHKHVHYTTPSAIHCTSSNVMCLFNVHLPTGKDKRCRALWFSTTYCEQNQTEFCNPKTEQLKLELWHVTVF